MDGMESDWRTRLEAAIKADGRSKRKISRSAGKGVNFVQQLLDGKAPSINNFMAVLTVLGDHSAYYVLTGKKVTPDDMEFLDLSRRLNKTAREAALPLLHALPQRSEDELEQ